ncbi:MAG: ATP-binding protein [Oligoflexales bacterium]
MAKLSKIASTLGSKLGKTLVLYILLSSSIITGFFTSISFYKDYKIEKELLNSTIEQINRTSKASLSKSLWNKDESQITIQVKSLLNITDITKVEIYDESDRLIISEAINNTSTSSLETHRFDLLVTNKETEKKVGRLEISITLDNIYSRLFNKALYFFLTQGITTLLVSFIMLLIFNHFVFRHILKMSNFLDKVDPSTIDERHQKLHLDIKGSNGNELLLLKEKINDIMTCIIKNNQASHKELKMQAGAAINSARLASLGEMAGGLAHEINNPLAVISNAANLAIRMVPEEVPEYEKSKLKSYHEKIEKNAWRISNIIKGLKRFARETGGEDFHDESVTKIVEGSLELCDGRAKYLGLKIQFSLKDEKDFEIECIPTEVSQVIFDLLNNSLYAVQSAEEKWIKIEAKIINNEAKISVIDSGNGISSDEQEKIFNPFFTTKPIGEAMGLGLSISDGIAKRHGGRLTLDTNSKWTRFDFSLPLKQ